MLFKEPTVFPFAKELDKFVFFSDLYAKSCIAQPRFEKHKTES